MARRRIMGAGIALVGLVAVAGLVVVSQQGGAPRASVRAATASAGAAAAVTPIRHVVVIFQENHSFDNVLGGLCVRDHLPCNGTTTGVLHDGTTIPLQAAADIVANVDHSNIGQETAINLGKMNGFDEIVGCAAPKHQCYSQYRANEIPNMRTLAESYVIADRTFSQSPVPSWGGHMDLIAGQLDGFRGDNPTANQNVATKPGWGCDSLKDAPWADPASGYSGYLMIPSCVPRADGLGPYRSSPAQHIPTILDRLTASGLPWKIYSDISSSGTGYIWSICPTFASCLYDPNNGNKPNPNWVTRTRFATDATAGTLPSYSVILPDAANSQHNNDSMLQGDNYIQSLVAPVMHGPAAQWNSTAFFITYDDCGCFYDHVAPPAGSDLGIRVPMVIVSPQAKRAFVDDTQASYDSMLAFVEKNWGLTALTAGDANAYDYCHSFVFTTLPCTGAAVATPNSTSQAAPTQVDLHPTPVPPASTQYVQTYPADPNDPT